MAATGLAFFTFGIRPQNADELREFDPVITSFQAHITIEARPNGLVVVVPTPVLHISLDYEPGIKIRIIPGNGANHGALTAVKAEMYPRIFDFLSMFSHGLNISLAGARQLIKETLDLVHKRSAVSPVYSG